MRTARQAMRACVALDGELRPQVLVRDARGRAAGLRVELSRVEDWDRLRNELHRDLPALLLELGARAAVLVCDDRALTLARCEHAELSWMRDTSDGAGAGQFADETNDGREAVQFLAIGADAAGGVALTIAPAERNEWGDLLPGECVGFDDRDAELILPSVPAPLWRGLGFCAN